MKNCVKLVGIIAVATIVGFSFAACGNGTTDSSQGDDIDHLEGTWECTSPDVEFEISKGKYENYFTLEEFGLFAVTCVLNGDVITVDPDEDPAGTFKVSLGNDEKLTVTAGTGKFATGFNGVYTKQPE